MAGKSYYWHMSNLVPEARVDKTGKTVIRHVRPENQKQARKTAAIPRTDSQRDKVKKLFNDAVSRLHACGFIQNFPLVNTTHNIFALAGESPETLEALIKHLESAPDTEWTLWEKPLINDRNHRNDWRDEVVEYAPTYRARMAVFPLIDRIVETNYAYSPELLADRIIRESEKLAGDDAEEDGYRRLCAASIVTGIYSLSSTINAKLHEAPDGKDQVEFIAEHLEDVQRMTEELIARKSTDIGLIRELISNGPTALLEGTL